MLTPCNTMQINHNTMIQTCTITIDYWPQHRDYWYNRAISGGLPLAVPGHN